MCVDMHHSHRDRKNILFLLRSCILLNVKREKEGNEKFKDDAYNIDHGFRPKSL